MSKLICKHTEDHQHTEQNSYHADIQQVYPAHFSYECKTFKSLCRLVVLPLLYALISSTPEFKELISLNILPSLG